MSVSLDLLADGLCDFIKEELTFKKFDAKKAVNTKAVRILQEIQDVLACESKSDFEIVEEIVCIFERHGISAEGRHDFG